MASVIKAGNATDGVQVTSDNTGIVQIKTGTGSGTTALTLDASQNATFAGKSTLVAGTTTIAPLIFTSGTNLTTATAGAVEYDGKVIYGTPQGTQRGVIPGAQFFRLNADLAGANVNTAQNTFGVGVTLSANTVYAFDAYYFFTKSAGATSHTFSIGFGGTATLNNILYGGALNWQSATFSSGNTGNPYTWDSNTAASTVATSAMASSATNVRLYVKGTVSVNAGGTFIPQYTLSAAPGGAYSTAAGSYFLIYPIGASGANTSVGTWA